MKLVQISDTHLTAAGGPTVEGFRLLARHLNEHVRPDVVVHSGDVVVLHPDDEADRAVARDLLALIDAPLLVLPGNHDVGMPGSTAWAGIEVSDARVAAHEAAFGPGHWRSDHPEAVLVGIESELLGSGLQREADQWRWLAATLADLPADRPLLLFLHKPLWPVVDGPTTHQLDIGPVARDRLLDLLEPVDVRVVGSGHLHRFREERRGRTLEVWAPATAFVTLDARDQPAALDELGYVEYTVTGGAVSAAYRTVPGLPRITSADVPGIAEAVAALTVA